MYGSRDTTATESGSNFETFRGWKTQHGMREFGFQFIKTRLTQTSGHVTNDASYCSSNAIVLIFEVPNERFHTLCGFSIRTPHGGKRVNSRSVNGF
jgi:hypothetical protein